MSSVDCGVGLCRVDPAWHQQHNNPTPQRSSTPVVSSLPSSPPKPSSLQGGDVGTPTLQFSFFCLHTNTHTDQDNSSLTTRANHSLTPSFSVYFHNQRKRPPASVLHPTSHAYQLYQPANGRTDWTAGDRNKRSPFGPTRFINSERSNQQHTHQERTHQDRRPDARLPGQVASWTGHTTARRASCSSTQHQSQPPQLHRRPTKHIASGSSLFTADQRLRHYMATQLYSAVNITQ